MNWEVEIFVIPMVLQAQQHPIFQGVHSSKILLCPRARARKWIVGIGGIGERVTDSGLLVHSK
jgi:hypothetical protein